MSKHVVFSLLWSVAGSCSLALRLVFGKVLHEICAGSIDLPPESFDLIDYEVEVNSQDWARWGDRLHEVDIESHQVRAFGTVLLHACFYHFFAALDILAPRLDGFQNQSELIHKAGRAERRVYAMLNFESTIVHPFASCVCTHYSVEVLYSTCCMDLKIEASGVSLVHSPNQPFLVEFHARICVDHWFICTRANSISITSCRMALLLLCAARMRCVSVRFLCGYAFWLVVMVSTKPDIFILSMIRSCNAI